MDVSVIIVNYNTKKLTADCIQSIIDKTSGVDYEIILVDNGSSDGSKEEFQDDRRIRYVYSDKNGGFGYGNNRGMEIARGKYLFLLNSDTILLNNAIKEFFEYSETHNQRCIYGCYLQGDDGSYRGSFHFFPKLTMCGLIKGLFCKPSYEPDFTDTEVECVCGADMFFPREAINEAGSFDENIFLYGEESELQLRMRSFGYKRMLINSPQIIHLEGQSMNESFSKLAIKMKSHFYVLRKHCTWYNYLFARAFFAALYTIHYLPSLRNKEARDFVKLLYTFK